MITNTGIQEGLLVQEALYAAQLGAASSATGVYIGCMYTEYLDSILGPQVRHAACLQLART